MWSLYEQDKFLEPLQFSNGKTQEDIVQEVLQQIKEGKKIILIHGVCGTGKSAIALNIAKNLGKSSVVVPGKDLQNQYKKDYEEKKYLLKTKDKKLKISVITGRRNHPCQFLLDNKRAIPIIKKEINTSLHDIFSGKREEVKKLIADDISADNLNIPCKIEIKERNIQRIKSYIRQNNEVDSTKFTKLKEIKRLPVAGACPYYSPVLPSNLEPKGESYKNATKKEYLGLNDTMFTIYQRKPGCKFYEQFNSFVDSDVMVFNSQKYLLETALNRKPATEVEIIDECDEFLDSFSNTRTINVNKFLLSLGSVITENEKRFALVKEIEQLMQETKRDIRTRVAIETKEIIPLKETKIYTLFKVFLDSKEFLKDIDEESYLFEIEEIAKTFEDFLEESYVIFEKKEENLFVNVVTTNLSKKLQNLLAKNKTMVMMSGTLHSPEVLKNVFGIQDFTCIEAEVQNLGQIHVKRTGKEKNCRFADFKKGITTREEYFHNFEKCVEIAKRPTLIHVHSFQDLPDKEEISKFNLKHLQAREDLMQEQQNDNEGNRIQSFKKGHTDILFSTRCKRGIDFPGKECCSIIFTKYPNPNISDPFWKILRRTKPNEYWGFYNDKARRELLQKVYRGLRFKEDEVELLSPDKRVLDYFDQENL